MTQQEMKEYYKHIEFVSYNDIEIIDLYHEKGDSNRHVHLVFEQNKLYYTGDMGTYVFGENIHDVKTFFKGSEINPYYWSEKVEAASDEMILTDLSEEKIKTIVDNELKEFPSEYMENGCYKEDIQYAFDDLFDFWEEKPEDVLDNLTRFFNTIDFSDAYGTALSIIDNCKEFDSHYLYACNLIQWVENEVL